MNMIKHAAAALMCLSLMPLTAQAQDDEWDAQVRELLDGAVEVLGGQGFTRYQPHKIEDLSEDTSDEQEVYLDGGSEYMIIGACDLDCSDIDMWLYDENRNLVDNDEEDDDSPILAISPKRSGVYFVKTKMYDCDAEPCSYGFAVLHN